VPSFFVTCETGGVLGVLPVGVLGEKCGLDGLYGLPLPEGPAPKPLDMMMMMLID
jgi:hypothetical protein